MFRVILQNRDLNANIFGKNRAVNKKKTFLYHERCPTSSLPHKKIGDFDPYIAKSNVQHMALGQPSFRNCPLCYITIIIIINFIRSSQTQLDNRKR